MNKKQTKVKFKGTVSPGNVLVASVDPPAVGLPPKILFNHRHIASVPTQFEVVAPEGYKLCIALVSSLSDKGMILLNAPGNITTGKVSAVLLNAGREIVEVANGDPLVTFWVEPIHNFQLDAL